MDFPHGKSKQIKDYLKEKIMKKSIFLSLLALVLAFGFFTCGDGSKEDEKEKEKEKEESFVLTVTGEMPSNIFIGVLASGTGIDSAVASAYNMNGKFTFYSPASPTMPTPNNSKPWYVPGSYTLVLVGGNLAEIMADFNKAEIHAYTGQFTVSDNAKTAEVAYNNTNFLYIPPTPEGSYRLNVTGLGTDTLIAIMVMSGQMPTAFGIPSAVPGYYFFYEPDGTMQAPDTTKPWAVDGTYMLMAVQPTTAAPTKGAQHTVSGTSGEIAWSAFTTLGAP